MSRIFKVVLFALILSMIAPIATAEDISKKWRVSLGGGGYNPVDEVDNNAANVLILRDEFFEPLGLFEDPRNDSGAFGNLDLKSGVVGTLAVQYAVNKVLILEGSVGYEKADLGDVDVAVQFLGNGPAIPELAFNFDQFQIPVGEVERVPIQLTVLGRFRPRASFNPYFGIGIGYVVQGFEADDEFNALSRNMDANRGTQFRLTNQLTTVPGVVSTGVVSDLSGASVTVEDTFEWHLVAGAELSFKRKWAVFGDVRWIDASRDISIGFNGGSELGVSVPQFSDFANSELGFRFLAGDGAGPVLISPGGLLDAGQLVWVRREGVSDLFLCDLPGDNSQSTECEFDWIPMSDLSGETMDPRLPEDFEPDGGLDSGFHYAQGGSFSTDGFGIHLGVRLTF